MRASRAGTRRQYFIGAWMLVAWCTTTVEAATIAGVVRDVHGNPIDGAQIKIICEQSPEKSAQVTSGEDGSYRFVELVPGKCQLSAERSGFRATAPAVVTLSSASASVVSDFVLSQLSQEVATTSPPKLKFEAAGIRGLIDPGGYSAPANAAAASGLISGVADIRRMGNTQGFVASKDLPCRLQPELTKAAAENPQNADANRRLGEFYLAHGSTIQAILYLNRARQIGGDDSRTIRDLSEALVASGQFNAAYEMLSLLPETEKDADYYQHLARAEEGLGQFTQAAEEYRIAAEKDPSDDENSFGVGYELILAGQPNAAAKAFNAALARHPSSMTLLIGAGAAEFLEGRGSEAVKLFLQAADVNPPDPRPYSFLVGAFESSGEQDEEVRASLERHLEFSPGEAEAYYLYALGLSHRSAKGGVVDNDRVQSLLKQAIALDPSLTKAHFQLGTMYAHQDDYESAAQEFEVTVQLAPDMKEAHYRLASAYKKIGRPEAAEHEMKLFREARDSNKTLNGEGGISIEQFISVVDRPGHTAAHGTQCPRNLIE